VIEIMIQVCKRTHLELQQNAFVFNIYTFTNCGDFEIYNVFILLPRDVS